MLVPQLSREENAAIINVSSGLGFVPAVKMPVCSATKAGLHAFSMAIRYQLKASGIKVFEVIPSAVDTELNREGRAKRGGYTPDLKPPEFVSAVMKGLAADQFEIGHGMTERSINAPPFLCALSFVGIERILFAVDYPCSPNAAGRAFLDLIPVSQVDREMIAHANAERLMKIPSLKY
jgi:short-subunit dehydrogenase